MGDSADNRARCLPDESTSRLRRQLRQAVNQEQQKHSFRRKNKVRKRGFRSEKSKCRLARSTLATHVFLLTTTKTGYLRSCPATIPTVCHVWSSSCFKTASSRACLAVKQRPSKACRHFQKIRICDQKQMFQPGEDQFQVMARRFTIQTQMMMMTLLRHRVYRMVQMVHMFKG